MQRLAFAEYLNLLYNCLILQTAGFCLCSQRRRLILEARRQRGKRVINKNQQRELIALIAKYSKTDGLNDTAIAPLHYFKMSALTAKFPFLYHPSLSLVAHGNNAAI